MIKKTIYISILTIISIFAFSCIENNKTGNTGSLSIIHMNDTHGRDEEEVIITKGENPQTNRKYGAARRAAYIKEVKATNDNVLILHAGDTITGSVYSTVFKGRDEVDIMNMLKVDAATIGNHFVDYGLENFTEIMKKRKFPTLSINIKNKSDNSLYAIPYITTNVNGLNIAIIGLTTTDAVYNPEYIKDLIFEEETKALKDFIKTVPLHKTNDITILLSHIGYEADKKVAEAMPNIFDIIIGGHSHTELKEADIVKGTPIVQTGYYGMNLGHIDLTVSNGRVNNLTYKLIPMDENIAQDRDMLNFIEEMKGTIDKEFKVRIASLPFELKHEGIRSNSIALGNFASDLVIDSYPNIDIVLMNSGGLRTPLPQGEITLGKIQNEFFPFDNEVIIVSLSGGDVIEMLKISGKKRGAGAFLQLSRGMEVKYNVINGDLIYAKLNGEDINPSKDYNIALSSFIFLGGDGYTDSEGNPIGKKGKNIVMTGNDIRDAMIYKLRELNNVPKSYIDEKPRVIFE